MNPTALEIIKKHTLKPDADYSDSWVLAAMREIYELGHNDGCATKHQTEFGASYYKIARLKELFPEK